MVINILKDGSVVADLSGHTVTKEDCPTVYAIITQIKEEEEE